MPSGESRRRNEGARGVQERALDEGFPLQRLEACRDGEHGAERVSPGREPLRSPLLPVDQDDEVADDQAGRLQRLNRLQLALAIGHDVVDDDHVLARFEAALDLALRAVALHLAPDVDQGQAAGQARGDGERQPGVRDPGDPVGPAAAHLGRQDAPDLGQHRRVRDHDAEVDVERRGDPGLQHELPEPDRADVEQLPGEPGSAGRVAHPARSRRIASAAAAGSAAPVIGRPTTTQSAPARMAAVGVAIRAWSPASEPTGRTPGVTSSASGPSVARSGRSSRGEATMPSQPAARAKVARWTTWPSTATGTASSRWSTPRSRLVSTVTARTRVRSRPASAAAAAAARSIALPPEAWTVRSETPSRAASRTLAPAIAGISWYWRSRKTPAPRLRTSSTAAGPAAVKSCPPTLKVETRPPSRFSSASASARPGTSRATISRSRGSRLIG